MTPGSGWSSCQPWDFFAAVVVAAQGCWLHSRYLCDLGSRLRPLRRPRSQLGSPVREGAIGAAIGIAGIWHAEEPEGDADLFGNASKPMMNRVDEIAFAASILMGQTAAARPVVVGRGVPYTVDENASNLGSRAATPCTARHYGYPAEAH